jgi:hypothetical protein
MAGSVVFCIAAVALGHWAAARLNGGVVQIFQTFMEEQG